MASPTRRANVSYMTLMLLLFCLALIFSHGISNQDQVFHINGRGEKDRCMLARREWRARCSGYDQQVLIEAFTAPRGAKECPNNCSGIGNCDHGSGLCDCPVGLTGLDCSEAVARPCTNRPRGFGSEPASHVDINGRDLGWATPGWMIGRCPGICDQWTNGACYCDGHIPAPPGSPPWVPPIRRGRPIGDHCKPRTEGDGRGVEWRGAVEFGDLYGDDGWCSQAVRPKMDCRCIMDGYHGPFCNLTHEQVCLNQCSMRGECYQGYCRCFQGYYGVDCAQIKAGIDITVSEEEASLKMTYRPWLDRVVSLAPEVAASRAQRPSSQAHKLRKRPLIYIYDLPQYTTKLLQNRVNRHECFYRRFDNHNKTEMASGVYLLESYLHEILLQSPHRTLDPEEADFYYVPVYHTCYMYPVWGFSDTFWYSQGPHFNRPLQASHMLLEAKRHIQRTYPFWNRSKGKDHVWLANHDEGACWWPSEIYNTSIILTHWGRLDLNHTSGTQYGLDNYSHYIDDAIWFKGWDWREIYRGHSCYTPGKDLVIPSFKWPSHYGKSPLMGLPEVKRDIRLFFKGDVGRFREGLQYSRGIRQKLVNLSKTQDWRSKHDIWIGDNSETFFTVSYSELLSRSVFCLVVPGDGWSSRAEDAISHGCLPFIIMDNVHSVYESIYSWNKFSIRIKECEIHRVPEILASISEERISEMQSRVKRIWMRFVWSRGKAVRAALDQNLAENRKHRINLSSNNEGLPLRKKWPYEQDAFGTLMRWLYSKSQNPITNGRTE